MDENVYSLGASPPILRQDTSKSNCDTKRRRRRKKKEEEGRKEEEEEEEEGRRKRIQGNKVKMDGESSC